MNDKIVVESNYQKIIKIEDFYYIIDKKDKLCVLPYTISSNGLLDKVGVIKDWNYIEEEEVLTLLNGYILDDDSTDLVAANRQVFEVLGLNITDADRWMYLGSLYSNMTSDSPIKVYCVDISDIQVKSDESVEDSTTRKNFMMLDASKVLQTDDMLFLASYLRLFNYFYVKSLSNNKNDK